MGFIFVWGKFSRRRQYHEKRENYPRAKISTFTVVVDYFSPTSFNSINKTRFLFSKTTSKHFLLRIGANLG